MKRMFKKMQLICIFLLIVVGIGIILTPWLNAWQFDVEQKRIMKLWHEGTVIDGGQLEANVWTQSVLTIGSESDGLLDEDINPDIDAQYLANKIDGILTIEKINLKVPILNEYTESNLNISICSVIPNNQMGQVGNYVIAGHESRIYGRHFNRLYEISAGDVIIAENKSEQFRYVVSEVFTVMPSDVWVMNNDGDKKIITLITCDYRTNPVGRLIVRGESS